MPLSACWESISGVSQAVARCRRVPQTVVGRRAVSGRCRRSRPVKDCMFSRSSHLLRLSTLVPWSRLPAPAHTHARIRSCALARYHPTLRPTPVHTRARVHARTCARALVHVRAETGARPHACAHACARACTNCVRAHFCTSTHGRTCACGPVRIDAALVPVLVPARIRVTVVLPTCFASCHSRPFV